MQWDIYEYLVTFMLYSLTSIAQSRIELGSARGARKFFLAKNIKGIRVETTVGLGEWGAFIWLGASIGMGASSSGSGAYIDLGIPLVWSAHWLGGFYLLGTPINLRPWGLRSPTVLRVQLA